MFLVKTKLLLRTRLLFTPLITPSIMEVGAEVPFVSVKVRPVAILIFPFPEIGTKALSFSLALIVIFPVVALVVVKSAVIDTRLPKKFIAPLIETAASILMLPPFDEEVIVNDLLTVLEIIGLEIVTLRLLATEGTIVKLFEAKAVSITEGATLALAEIVIVPEPVLTAQPVPDVPVSPLVSIVRV